MATPREYAQSVLAAAGKLQDFTDEQLEVAAVDLRRLDDNITGLVDFIEDLRIAYGERPGHTFVLDVSPGFDYPRTSSSQTDPCQPS